jgi:hypothetical protein
MRPDFALSGRGVTKAYLSSAAKKITRKFTAP